MDLLCMDLFVLVQEGYAERILRRAGLALAALGPAMLLLGTVLPWLPEEYRLRGGAGWLYATNTLGSVAGSLCATWWLLPALGFAHAAWAIGVGIALLAAGLLPGRPLLALVPAPAAPPLPVAAAPGGGPAPR